MNETAHNTLPIVEISLYQIKANGFNVRRTGADKGIEELAASIRSIGLRQNLNVREIDGGFEIVSGHRRFAALNLLVKKGELAVDAKIPCLVVEAGENPVEIALAENAVREQMHPADQFEAFDRLVKEGQPVDDIAARFGVSPAVVKQRLKLASVSPKVMDAYRDDKMTLEHLMAFTLTDDHKRQESAWDYAIKGGLSPASVIRQQLMDKSVKADDRLVKFVTLKAYEAAGGPVTRDLFETDRCYVDDAPMLHKMADDKMKEIAQKLQAEGWSWVEAHTGSIPYETSMKWFGDNYSPKKSEISKEDRAKCGVRVGIDYNGKVEYEYGRLNKQQVKEEKKEERAAAIERGETVEPETGDWSGPQLGEMNKILTFALADAVLQHNVHFSWRILAYALGLDLYRGDGFYGLSSALAIHHADHMHTRLEKQDLIDPDELASFEIFRDEHKRIKKMLPAKPEKLWDWCQTCTLEELYDLLKFLTARAVDAIRHDAVNVKQIQAWLLPDLSLSMKWQPTAAGFIGRMNKKQLAQALIDAGKPEVAEEVSKLKKGDACTRAAEELKGTGWLPQPLAAPEKKKPASKKGAKSE